MRILAVIPARGGSKRLPGKNIRPLGGKPLIAWSIDAAKDNANICDILVTTDDQPIADVSRAAGALVPWLRPIELASDTASSVDVALHALDWYEEANGKVDGLLLLQPTSPFRSRNTIARGIEVFRTRQQKTVLGVSPAASHPLWCFRVEDMKLRPYTGQVATNLRSQDLPPAYVVNGSFYLIKPETFRQCRSFVDDGALALVIDQPCESIDIDTAWDWKVAEAALTVLFPNLAIKNRD